MDIILIPGHWLHSSSWDEVVPVLEKAGHRTHPVTLPGMESKDADRSQVTLRDHIDAVVEAIDGVDPAGQVLLVGHSAGGALAHAAVDARPDRVARVVYVGGEPRGSDDGGSPWPVVNGEVPLPDWSFFDEEMVADLDEEQRARIREGSIPVPARVASDPLRLSGDDRRCDVPATIIACEFPSSMYRQWIDEGHAGVQELARLRKVEYVDLPGGHWPQFAKPAELGRVILTSI